MDAERPIVTDPFGHTYVLLQLAATQRAPSEQRFQTIGIDAHVDVIPRAADHAYLVLGQKPFEGGTDFCNQRWILGVAGNTQTYGPPIWIRKIAVANGEAY